MKSSAGPLLLLAVAALVAGFAAPAFAASSAPPIPRPRPDHVAQPSAPTTQPGDQGDDDNADALVDPGPAPKLGTTPQPVTLTAELMEKGPTLTDGLVWRVFDTKPDKNGQFPIVAKSEQASPTLKLVPGDYVVDVAYGRAQASDTLSIGDAASQKQMILDAGGLKLNALNTGDLPIPVNLLHFDVFTAGATDADRTLVAEKVGPQDILTLNAGTYHIVSYYGDINAIVRADLRVEPGQLTDATLYQKGAQVSFKLVSEAGGEAIADVDWAVSTKDGTQPIFTNTGTFPATVLAEGDYTVTAKRGDKAYSRSFAVKAGKPLDVEVATTGGPADAGKS